jgi:hypothetical protein
MKGNKGAIYDDVMDSRGCAKALRFGHKIRPSSVVTWKNYER